MATTDTQYRVVRNLKHNGSRFAPGQVVSGFEPETAEYLVSSGTLELVSQEQPAEVLQADAKKPGATVVGGPQEQAPAPSTPAATVVTPPQQPPAPQTPQAPQIQQQQTPAPGQPGGRALTPEEQAVANTAAQVN